jgi:hypothetical protein
LIELPSLDLGTLEGKVLGPTGLLTIGTTVIAEKELGVITSAMKDGGYTANSFVTVDGSYNFKVPSVVYKITVAFPDGTNQITHSDPAHQYHLTSCTHLAPLY